MTPRERVERLEHEAEHGPEAIIARFHDELDRRRHEAALAVDAMIAQHVHDDQVPGLREQIPHDADREHGSPLMELLWLLAKGDCVLPRTASGAQWVIQSLLAPPREYSIFAVCDGCGCPHLPPDRPADPDVLRALAEHAPMPPPKYGPPCPECGHPTWTWDTRLNEQPHPWRTNPMVPLNDRFPDRSAGHR